MGFCEVRPIRVGRNTDGRPVHRKRWRGRAWTCTPLLCTAAGVTSRTRVTPPARRPPCCRGLPLLPPLPCARDTIRHCRRATQRNGASLILPRRHSPLRRGGGPTRVLGAIGAFFSGTAVDGMEDGGTIPWGRVLHFPLLLRTQRRRGIPGKSGRWRWHRPRVVLPPSHLGFLPRPWWGDGGGGELGSAIVPWGAPGERGEWEDVRRLAWRYHGLSCARTS